MAQNGYTGFLDTQDLGFATNQYGMFPFPTLAKGVVAHKYDPNDGKPAIKDGGKLSFDQQLSAYFHTPSDKTNESVKVNGTQRVSTKKGIFFDTITSGQGNNNKFTGNVTTSHKINQNGKNHITAIHKRGKFPFILNLGGGHFISLVLHKKPSKGFEKNATWQVAITNSSSPDATGDAYNAYKEIIDSFNKSPLLFKKYFGTVNAKNAQYHPCVGQVDANCLLNTYINCRNSQVDEKGSILFPGKGKHPMDERTVKANIRVLRNQANAYGGYGIDRNKSVVNNNTKDKISENYNKFENQQKFQRVLSRLSEINQTRWKLTGKNVAEIFNAAENKRGYTRKNLPVKSDEKYKEKREFSVEFQKLCAEEGLFTLNDGSNISSGKHLNKEVGMRTKWVIQFAKNNLIPEGDTISDKHAETQINTVLNAHWK